MTYNGRYVIKPNQTKPNQTYFWSMGEILIAHFSMLEN